MEQKFFNRTRIIKLEGNIWTAGFPKNKKIPFLGYWIESYNNQLQKYVTDYYICHGLPGCFIKGTKLWCTPTNVIDEMRNHDYLLNEVMDKKFTVSYAWHRAL